MVDWGKAAYSSTRTYAPSGRSLSSPYSGSGSRDRMTYRQTVARKQAVKKKKKKPVIPELQNTTNPFQAGFQPESQENLLTQQFKDFGQPQKPENLLTQQFKDFGQTQPQPKKTFFERTGGFAEAPDGSGVVGWVKAQFQDQLRLMEADPDRVLAASIVSPLLSIGGTTTGATLNNAFKVGKPASTVTSTVGKFATNTKTIKLTQSMAAKAVTQTASTSPSAARLLVKYGGPVVFGAWFVQEIMGTYPFAERERREAEETMEWAFRFAAEHGDEEGMAEASMIYDELVDPTMDTLIGKIPFGNVWDAAQDRKRAQDFRMRLNKKYAQDKINNPGESDDEKWARIKAEEDAAFQASVDTRLAKERVALDYELDARAKSTDEYIAKMEGMKARDRSAQKRMMENQAAFWLKYREDLAKLEEEERIRIAEFWFEYKKLVLELEGAARQTGGWDSGRSTLGFGLL